MFESCTYILAGKRQSRRKCGDITQLEKNIISRKVAKVFSFALCVLRGFSENHKATHKKSR